MLRKSILCISDQHAPYQHPDTLDFLSAIKKEYKPDCVVNMGDELDWHSISFHDHHPGLYSPKDELETAKIFFKKLHTMFPKMYVLDSNHGSLVFKIHYWQLSHSSVSSITRPSGSLQSQLVHSFSLPACVQ